jgi:hypothetical protein
MELAVTSAAVVLDTKATPVVLCRRFIAITATSVEGDILNDPNFARCALSGSAAAVA